MVISSRLVARVLARNSNKKTARKLIRSILLETLEKRELMTTDLSNPLTTGLSQNGSIVDQYVGFGLPARPYSAEELKLNEGQHGIGLGPQQLVWLKDPASVVEGNPIRFDVMRSGTSGVLTVGYRIGRTSTASPGRDFEYSSGIIQFDAGSDIASVVFQTMDDMIPESTENLELQLLKIGSAQVTVSSETKVAEVFDNDSLSSVSVFGFASSFETESSDLNKRTLAIVRSSSNLGKFENVYLSIKSSDPVLVDGVPVNVQSSGLVRIPFSPWQDSASVVVTPSSPIAAGDRIDFQAEIVPDSSYVVDVSNREQLTFEHSSRSVLDYVTAYATSVTGRAEGVIDLSRITKNNGFIYVDTNQDGVIDRSISLSSSTSVITFPLPSSSTADHLQVSYSYSIANSLGVRIEDWRSVNAKLPQPQQAGPIRIIGVGLLTDTSPVGDSKSANPTITGSVFGQWTSGTAEVEFDHNADGLPDGSIALSGGNRIFVYDPRSDANFDNQLGARTIGYRLRGDGDWDSIQFELSALPASRLDIGDFSLSYRPGSDAAIVSGAVLLPNESSIRYSPSMPSSTLLSSGYVDHRSANNSTLVGDLPSDREINPNAGLVSIEVDLNGDDSPDRILRVDGDLTFKSTLPELISGAHWVGIRISEWTPEFGDRIHSDWTRYFVNLGEQFPLFSNVAYNPSLDGVAAPTIAGTLIERGRVDVNESRIDVDWNLDGIVDATTIPSSLGGFQFALPAGFDGRKTIAIRAGLLGGRATGDFDQWSSFTFDAGSSAFPVVESLTIANSTDSSLVRSLSIDLVGSLSSVSDRENIRIEFDKDLDGAADGSATLQTDGQFYYGFETTEYGSHTIAYRTAGWNASMRKEYQSPWQQFTFASLAPAQRRNLDSEASGEPGDSNGVLTFPIELVGLIHPSYNSVEVDWTNDFQLDTSASVVSGEFSVSASSIPSGTTQLTVRGVRNDGNTIDFSPWVSIPISSWQSDGWPGLVTNLALLSDSGEDFTDGQTENTTIVGSVYIANATSLDGIKVQVDENGDGISDGMTTTDSEGGFVFEPSFLPIGNASVRFRAVRWSDSQSNYRVGPWSSISFLFEDQIDGAARIRNVGKTAAIAANGTNLQSTVSGRITNESSLLGIVVEIDLNDDDAADQVVTTDRFGRFSSTIIGSSNQLDAMRVRTRELDPVSRVTHYGPWVIVSESYGAGGGGTGTGGSENEQNEGFDGADLSGGDSQFDSEVSLATATHKAALESAKQSYNQQLASADAAYAVAVELAGANFQTLLSNFNGNTTSFEYTPFSWPQSPSSGTEFPSDSSQATPPVAKPTYTGPLFDFDEDSIYQAAINANRNAYQAELAAAKTALNSAKSSAEQAHNARVEAINQEYENAAQAAQNTFEAESEVDDSALDALAAAFQAAVDAAWAAYTSAAQALATALNTSLTSAWDTLQSQIQAANDTYWNAVTAASNAYTNATDHEGCTCDEERSASINYSQSVYEAGKTLDKAVSSARAMP